MKKILSLGLLLASSLSPVFAQDTTSQAIEDRRYKTPSDAVGALGPDLFGEQTDHNTGSTSFSATDIDLPGNNALPVRLTRSVRMSVSDGFPHLVPLGVGGTLNSSSVGWSIDVPHLSGIFSSAGDGLSPVGWVSDSSTRDLRCSTGSGRPPNPDPGNPLLEPHVFWSGTKLTVPGQTSNDILLTTATSQNNTTQAARWTTKDHWLLTCLPTITNGSGEGFLATSPDGTKYYFNRMVTKPGNDRYSKIIYGTSSADALTGATHPLKMNRVRYHLVATKVEDRFGNYVNYNYNTSNRLTSIASSDGRTITLNYNGSNVITSATAHGKTWTYAYDAAGKFVSATLPDASKWEYALTGGFFRGSLSGSDDPPPGVYCNNNVAYVTQDLTYIPGNTTSKLVVKHPSGATGTFDFTATQHYNPWEATCAYESPRPLQYIDALVSKKIAGPGLVDQVWSYNYDVLTDIYQTETQCLQGACPTAQPTRITQPDGTVLSFNFKLNGHYAERGQTTYDTTTKNLIELKRTTYTNVSADAANQGFNTMVGINPLGHVLAPQGGYYRILPGTASTEYELPSKQKDIIQDGVTFTWKANGFDPFARANSVSLSNSLNPGVVKTDTYVYKYDTAKWVLGQLETSTNANTATQVSRSEFDPVSVLPIRLYEFNSLKETLTYNADGTMASVKNANNNTTSFASYKRGIPQTITNPDSTFVSAVVNDFGKLTSISNELGFATGFGYDAMNRLSSITPPAGDTVAWAGATQTFAINTVAAYGLPAGHWKQTISKGNYRKEIYFNARWQPVVTREYDNSNIAGTQRFTRMAYDTTGRTVFTSYPGTTDALTTGVRTEYDALGRVTKTMQDSELLPNAGVLNTITEYLTGFQTRVTNPRGFATTTSYQVWDSPDASRPEIIVAPEGITTTILRNTYGKTLEVTRSGVWNGSPLSSTRKYVYDNEQRLCKRIEPETGATIIDYDAVDNLAWSVQGSALTSATSCDRTSVATADKTIRSYNTMNRLLTTDVPGSTNDLSYTYFADGALQSLTSGSNRWDYTYNKLRLPVNETLTMGTRIKTLTHAYNTMAQESSLTYPSGLVVATTPNALGQATQAGTFATGVSYYANNGMSAFAYGNGIAHTMTPNTRMLPSLSKDMDGSIAILHDTYSYDANGNVASIADGTTGAGGNRAMTYDNADRLIRTNAPNQWWIDNYLTYDALDNIRVNTLGNRTHNYQYNATTQRLDSLTLPNATVARALGYDTLGNVTTNGTQAYVFDKANRMQSVNGLESYEYDGHGRRVKITRISDSKISYPMYSLEGKIIADEDQRSNKTNDYVYLNGSLVAKRSATIGTTTYTTSYQHTDSLGSPVAESDAAKTVTFIKRYTPYGEPSDQNYVQGPGFTSHVTDAATGLTYAQQRYYDPIVGRFLSADPMDSDEDNGWNFNRYNYAANNPYKYTDPDGRVVDVITDSIDVVKNAGQMFGYAAAFVVGKATGDEMLASTAAESMVEGRADMAIAGAAVMVPGANSASLKAGAALAGKAVDAKRAVGAACSFDDDTLVQTENGYSRIADIEFGSKVLAKNEFTNAESYQTVTATFNEWHATTLTITLESAGKIESIITTDEHPFFVIGSGFVPAAALKEGNEIQLAGSGIAKVVSSKRNDVGQLAYNLTVDNDHTYFVGESKAWVHNACKGAPVGPKAAAKAQFRKESAGFDKKVIRSGRDGTGKIVGVGTAQRNGPTYRPKADGSYSVGKKGDVKHYRSDDKGGHTVDKK